MNDNGRYSQKSNKRDRGEVNYYGNGDPEGISEQGNNTSSSSSRNQHLKRKQPSNNEFVGGVDQNGNEVFKRVSSRVPVIQKSLAIVLASLLGVQVVIELKNDTEVTGTIDEADSNMNLTLHDVRQISSSGEVLTIDILFLTGNTIRYVHIPKEYPIIKHLSLYMKTIERVSVRGPRKIVDRKRKENDDIPDC